MTLHVPAPRVRGLGGARIERTGRGSSPALNLPMDIHGQASAAGVSRPVEAAL